MAKHEVITDLNHPYDHTMVEGALQALSEFLPHFEKARAINLPGWQQIQSALEQTHKELMDILTQWPPHEGRVDG